MTKQQNATTRDYATEIAYYEAKERTALAQGNYDTAHTYALAAYYARRQQEEKEEESDG